jgi:hypothetical protein
MLPIDYDNIHDIVTICGIRYSGDIFRELGGLLPVRGERAT